MSHHACWCWDGTQGSVHARQCLTSWVPAQPHTSSLTASWSVSLPGKWVANACVSLCAPAWDTHNSICVCVFTHHYILLLSGTCRGHRTTFTCPFSFHCASPRDIEPFPTEPCHWLLVLLFLRQHQSLKWKLTDGARFCG